MAFRKIHSTPNRGEFLVYLLPPPTSPEREILPGTRRACSIGPVTLTVSAAMVELLRVGVDRAFSQLATITSSLPLVNAHIWDRSLMCLAVFAPIHVPGQDVLDDGIWVVTYSLLTSSWASASWPNHRVG